MKKSELLKGLTNKQRAYVMLSVTHPEMTMNEIAARLGITPSTLSTNYNGNSKLQDIIATFLSGQLNALMPRAYAKFSELVSKGDVKSIHLMMRILLKQGKTTSFDMSQLEEIDEEEPISEEDSDVDEILKDYEV